MKFTSGIFYLFFHILQVLSYATYCSGHNIYAFGIILDCLLQYPNGLALLNNYPNEVMTIDIYFWITRANFLNVNHQPVIFVKTSNNFILSFAKVLYWIFCFCKNRNSFLVEGMMGWMLVLTRRFILNNTKKFVIKYHNRSSKNPINLFCVSCLLWKNRDSTKKCTKFGYVFILSRFGGTTP